LGLIGTGVRVLLGVFREFFGSLLKEISLEEKLTTIHTRFTTPLLIDAKKNEKKNWRAGSPVLHPKKKSPRPVGYVMLGWLMAFFVCLMLLQSCGYVVLYM
jgi:hypothetical protein